MRVPAMSAVQKADNLRERLAGGTDIVLPGQTAKLLRTPAHRLATAVLLGALEDAAKGDSKIRRAARNWLQADQALYSARVCCEALGIDYDAAIGRLKRRWRGGRD